MAEQVFYVIKQSNSEYFWNGAGPQEFGYHVDNAIKFKTYAEAMKIYMAFLNGTEVVITPTPQPVNLNCSLTKEVDLLVKSHVAYCDHGGPCSYGSLDDMRFLTMGLAGEAGEIANLVKKEHAGIINFNKLEEEMKGEIADVFTYLALLADAFGIDMATVVREKRQIVIEKFKKLKLLPESYKDD